MLQNWNKVVPNCSAFFFYFELHFLSVFTCFVCLFLNLFTDSFSSWNARRTNTDLSALPRFPEHWTGNLNCWWFRISCFHCSVTRATKSLFFTASCFDAQARLWGSQEGFGIIELHKTPPGGVMALYYNRTHLFLVIVSIYLEVTLLLSFVINLFIKKTHRMSNNIHNILKVHTEPFWCRAFIIKTNVLF